MFRSSTFAYTLAIVIALAGYKSFATTYYTYTNGGSNGLWAAAGTWTTDPSGVSLVGSAVPGNGDVVYILNGYTVILDANVATTGLTIVINNGGTLDLSTFTVATISNLSGSGTLKIQSGYFPSVTTNSFVLNASAGATVEYYNFTGLVTLSGTYPNLIFSNSTSGAHTISMANPSSISLTVNNFVTQNTGMGSLGVIMGTQNGNAMALTVGGNITIGAGTTWGVGVFNSIHFVEARGNMTNNGTVDFSNSAQFVASGNGAANITFTGASNNSLACNGVTDLYKLTVNKGLGSTNILSVTSTDVNNLKFFTNDEVITITRGTLRLGSNINITRIRGTGNYNLGSETESPMLWIDGANVNFNSIALVVYGKFRITSGSFSSLGGEGTVIRIEGQYIIEGGTFTTEKFRPSTEVGTHRGSFVMSGGTFNAVGTGSNGAYARFSLPFPDQVFIMSGGTINVSNPQSSINGGIHLGCNPANYQVTGGTFNAILSGGAAFFNIASSAPFWNLNISRTGGTPTTVRLAGIGSVGGTIQSAQPLTVLNDFTIDGTNNPLFNANNLNVSVGRNFVINSGATYTPNGNITTFNGTTDQYFTNNGTITSGLYDLTVNKSSGALILDGSAAAFTVTQLLNLNSGVLNDGGKTLFVSGHIQNNAIHTGTGRITLNGTATQIISGNGNGVFGNLTLDNSSTPGVSATSNIAVSGILTLAGTGNSLFDISQYQLTLTSTSATALTTTGNGFSSAKMIRTLGLQSDAGIRKTYGNLSAFTFAFGAGTSYTPATIQITAAPTSYGTITARPVDSRHQFTVAGNTNNLTWYWKVVSAGFTGLGANAVTHSYQYLDANVSPAGDDVNYIPARYNPTAWTVISNLAMVNETTNVISFTGVGYIDGEFTAGVPAAFGTVKIFYSMRSGNWNNTTTGQTPWSNVSHSGPEATTFPVVGDHVYIGGAGFNHTITISSNSQACGGLEISAGSTLDVGVYTGHNFGTFENAPITGSGLLRISSASPVAEFPAGDFGNFIRASGGTVEYYTTAGQSFSIPTSSSVPTDLPLISYRHLVITPEASTFIAMPPQNVRIYGNMTVQGAASTGIARLNTATLATLTINGNLLINSGTLQFQNNVAQILDVDGNISIATGATFNVASTGTVVTNQLYVQGNIINNGILDLSNGAYVCNTTFDGTTNSSITGSGATTDFNILMVSKGSSQTPVLEVNATAFSLSGPTLPLVLVNGTFRLTSSQTVTVANGVDFSIPATAKLSANGGTLQLTGGDGIDMLVAGTLEVLNGTINVGTTSHDNAIEYAATGQPTITASGGTLNVQAQVRRSFASAQGGLIYNQSGTSVVNISLNSAKTVTRGVFEILNTGSSFTMSGGILRINNSSNSSFISDLYIHPSSSNVTGGTIELGGAAESQIIDVNSIIPLYNVSVTGVSNTARLEFNNLVMLGSLSIGSGDVFNANARNVSIGGNFINENIDNSTGTANGGYQPGSATQTTTFNSTINNQTISGVGGNLTNFANLVINNTFSGGTVALLANTNLRVNNTLTLTNGVFAGSDNTITAIGTVSNSSTYTSLPGGSITLQGTSGQVITGNGSGKFGNLVLNNASGASFGANQEITGTLTLTNGSLFIGSFNLNISNTSLTSITGVTSTRYIITSGLLSDGGVTKAFAANVNSGNFIYPIGVSGKYTPANYTISTGAIGGTITVRPVNSKHPSATGSGTAYINYYWSVTNSVILLNSLTHTYTYTASDESGNAIDYRDARFKGGAWTIGISAGNPNITTRVITFTNTDVAGDYTAGEPTAFVNPTTYTSIASGNWESDLAVWDIDPPGTNLGPPAGSFVIISEGHTVTVTGNGKRMATLEVRGRLHLGNTIGHDFGTVTAAGAGDRTIQLQSSTFPSGDFSAFTDAGGGTVDYNGTVILPTQNTYNNLSFSGAGTKTLPNADLTINGNLTVYEGTVTNAVNNRSVVLVSTTGDFTNNATFNVGSGVLFIGRHLVNSGAGANFIGGDGSFGLRIGGNFINSASATFTLSLDSIGVRGNFNNSATFNGGAGDIRVTGNLNNSAGMFTGGSGIIEVKGNLTNNAAYNAGSGATSVRGSYLNTSASAVYNANANTLTVRNNFTNNAGATFNAGTGAILTGGTWINGGGFNAETGSVTFSGISAQSLTGSTTFYNLTRANGGSLNLNSNISVSNILTLASGNIVTGSNTVSVTATSVQPVVGFSASSFIDGRLVISYPTTAGASRIFPVGKGSIYRPVTIQQTALSSSPVVRVEMVNTPPTGTYPVSSGIMSQARYYAVDLISGVMNSPTVELNFNTNGAQDEMVLVPGNVHILKATASNGPWTDEGGSGVFSPAAPAGYATSGITSISNPTFFALVYPDPALPITLKSFDARLIESVVELKWSTYSEMNNNYFTIERSVSGLDFDSIGFVLGAGTSHKVLNYDYTDFDPLHNVSYYRLRQTDYDGRYSYSDVVRIVNGGLQSMLNVYPNPVKSGESLFIKVGGEHGKTTQLVISGIAGKIFFKGVVDLSSEKTLNDLNVDLECGVYFVHVVSGNSTETRKVIIR